MVMKLKDLEEQISQLSAEKRARLLEHLIATLDTGEDVDAEELWLAEAEERYQEYRAGKLTSRPADAVFEDAASKLK